MAITTERIRELLVDAAEPTASERQTGGAIELSRPPAKRPVYAAAIAAASVLALVGVVLLVSARDHGRTGRDQVRPAASATASSQPLPPASLVGGRWSPSTGTAGTQTAGAYVMFQTDGTWSGYDGCNHFGGTYTYAPAGTFSAKIAGSTLAYCRVPPIGQWLAQAKRVEVSATGLQLFAEDGRLIGTLVRVSS